MQYKHFDADKDYLPQLPSDLSEPCDGSSSSIGFDYYQSIGGQDNFASLVAGGTVTCHGTVTEHSDLNFISTSY